METVCYVYLGYHFKAIFFDFTYIKIHQKVSIDIFLTSTAVGGLRAERAIGREIDMNPVASWAAKGLLYGYIYPRFPLRLRRLSLLSSISS
jgi:hypothetical protein